MIVIRPVHPRPQQHPHYPGIEAWVSPANELAPVPAAKINALQPQQLV